MKMQENKVGVRGSSRRGGGQGGCERRIEIIVKMQENKVGGEGVQSEGGWGSGWM